MTPQKILVFYLAYRLMLPMQTILDMDVEEFDALVDAIRQYPM